MSWGAGAVSAGGHISGAGPAGAGATPEPTSRNAATPPLGRRRVLAIAMVAVVGGAGVRLWQIWGRSLLEWTDTADFVAVSGFGWTSLGLWAGQRPVGPPLLLKVVGGEPGAYVVGQAAVAVACWAALAMSVAAVVARPRIRRLAVAAVVVMSVTTPVTMWERSVLSESLAISLLALVVAAGVQVARGATRWRVAALLAACALWAAIRDTHAAVMVAGGGVAAAGSASSWLLGWRQRRRVRRHAPEGGRAADAADGDGPRLASRSGDGSHPAAEPAIDAAAGPGPDPSPHARPLWAVLGLGAVALGLMVGWASSHGERHAFPMRNVFEVRVLPYADRVQWFADHGMPQPEAFVGPQARAPHIQPNMAPVVYVPDDDPQLGPWLDWVETEGRATFARFVATHPLYLVFEPVQAPERAFNNAAGDREFYAPLDMRRVPLVDRVLAPSTTVVLAAATAVTGWVIGRGRWSAALAAGLAVAVLAVPHGLAAWHGDGMETARHLVVPAVQLQLGVLLMLVGVASGVGEIDVADSGVPSPHS